MSAEAAKLQGEFDACGTILAGRAEAKTKVIEERRKYNRSLPRLREDALAAFDAAITPNGLLVAAVLEEEGALTREQLAGWCDELSMLEDAEFDALLKKLVRENVISVEKDGVFRLKHLVTETMTDPPVLLERRIDAAEHGYLSCDEDSKRIAKLILSRLASKKLLTRGEIRKQASEAETEPYFYAPLVEETFWLCACGHPAPAGAVCPFCGDNVDALTEAFRPAVLEEAKKTAVKARAQARCLALDRMRESAGARAEKQRKEQIEGEYGKAVSLMEKDTVEDLQQAIGIFGRLQEKPEAAAQIPLCEKRIEELKAQAEAARLEAERKAEEEKRAAEAKKKRNARIGVVVGAVAALGVVLLIVWTAVIQPKQAYGKALQLMEAGDYAAAFSSLENAGNSGNAKRYDDALAMIGKENYNGAYLLLYGSDAAGAEQKLQEIRSEAPKALLLTAQPGETVFFGSYWQENADEKTAIEWKVLKRENEKLLLISEQALAHEPFSESRLKSKWKDCTLRTWLNDVFLNDAFTGEEQQSLLPENDGMVVQESKWSVSEKVFLLSKEEAELYFTSDEARQCEPTAYAVEDGVILRDNRCCGWWLRTNGTKYASMITVNSTGDFFEEGNYVDLSGGGVRPAVWVDPML